MLLKEAALVYSLRKMINHVKLLLLYRNYERFKVYFINIEV